MSWASSVLMIALAFAGWNNLAFGQAASLDFLSKPAMIECESESGEPCFRLQFGFIDAAGKPASVQLPPPSQLASQIEVQIDGQDIKPFYAAEASSPGETRRPELTILLFDISGSMLATDLGGHSRFDAARDAAAEYVKNITDGEDSIAVVPFASRHVESTIEAAHFVSTKAEVQQELNDLPRPQVRNNTALYSAVRAAVELLRKRRQGDQRARLILLTDGTNDVHPQAGDDSNLLNGADGLAAAASAVQRSGVDILPIGLGNRQSIDEAAMARLGTRPPLITFDLDGLRKAFQLGDAPQNGRVTATVQAPQSLASRTLLAGQVVRLRAKMTLPDGAVLVEDRPALWVAPPVATPAFEGEGTDAEQRAYLMGARIEHASALVFWRPFLVFASLAAILALLWFGLPRLLWPERYDRGMAKPLRAEYWPAREQSTRSDHGPSFRQAPPGFEVMNRGARAASRSAGEHTIVRPITSFDPSKTRLR